MNGFLAMSTYGEKSLPQQQDEHRREEDRLGSMSFL